MSMPFEKSKWIWTRENYGKDEYAEFTFDLNYSKGESIVINIASDSNYNLIINGDTVEFGQYPDFPFFKVYDSIDITKYLKEKNKINIIVWYYGEDTQNYIKDKAGLIFEIIKNDKVILFSDENILSRLYDSYENSYCKKIAHLGCSFKYYGDKECSTPFTNSVLTEKSKNFSLRPVKKLVLGSRVPTKTTKVAENTYLIDLGEETVGFLDLDFESQESQYIKILYSEFLQNERVPSRQNHIDYSVEYVSKKGINNYVNYFRRIAGRYLEVQCESDIKINYIGILPTDYPIEIIPRDFESSLRNKIYNTAVKTLRCCMHEHFEDCPSREQALYIMDARNEMLSAFVAFNDIEYSRSNIVLVSKSLRKDGLLSLCAPIGESVDIPIPFFSLIFTKLVYEYIEHTGDKTILNDVFDVCTTVIKTFINELDKDGLIKNFPYPCWNYYEWSPGSSNGDQITRKSTDFYPEKRDLILNCMFVISIEYYEKLCNMFGKSFDYNLTKTKESIVKVFYDNEKKAFKASDLGTPFYTALGNALAISCRLADEKLADKIINNDGFVPITLSSSTFLYDALINLNKEKYQDYILNDIDTRYKRMLDAGATTFWETEEMVNSLCHGWSALPIYYYNLLCVKDK